MLLTTLPLSNLRRPARPSPSLSFFHVPFFLFFPFRRHLLPRENSTIGRGRPLRTPSRKVDHSDSNCCIVQTHFARMDNTDSISRGGFDRRCRTRFGQIGSAMRGGAGGGGGGGGGMFSHTTDRLRAERAGSSKKSSKKGTTASE